jgi:phenol 2-monooxygenase
LITLYSVIIGAGPAGLMAAWWMARCGISARIIDKRGKKVINGHADGLRPRTEDLFDSMGGGVQEKIQAEGYIFENMMNWVRIGNSQPETSIVSDGIKGQR